jgi:hypothetical protein
VMICPMPVTTSMQYATNLKTMAKSLAIHACVGKSATHSEVEIIGPKKPWCAKPSLPSSLKSFRFRSQLHGPHHQKQVRKLPPSSPTFVASSTSPNSPRTQFWPNSCSTHFFFPSYCSLSFCVSRLLTPCKCFLRCYYEFMNSRFMNS